MKKNKPSAVAAKPYLTGAPADENTLRQALKFFGMLLLVLFMTFLVCSMTGFKTTVLRVLVNLLIEALILLVVYNKGVDLGTEAVARGEILYQHVQKGQTVAASERKIPFHRLKGFVIGIAGTLPFLLCAVILALTAQKQMTSAGVLPSWTQAFMKRTEFRDALVQYTQTSSMTFMDIVRIIVRILMMPFISMAGAENRDMLLSIERLSPLLVLLPAASYGTGYLQGPARRKQIHSEIAENSRRRIIREKREKRAKRKAVPKGPEQLN